MVSRPGRRTSVRRLGQAVRDPRGCGHFYVGFEERVTALMRECWKRMSRRGRCLRAGWCGHRQGMMRAERGAGVREAGSLSRGEESAP